MKVVTLRLGRRPYLSYVAFATFDASARRSRDQPISVRAVRHCAVVDTTRYSQLTALKSPLNVDWRLLASAFCVLQTAAMVLLLYGYPKRTGWWPPPARFR
jgi:hypothetical protein